MSGRLILSGAGSGKTTYLIHEAMRVAPQRVLITTFTDANTLEIEKKFYEEFGCVPQHVTIMPWFTFLIEHGIRPYQGQKFTGEIRGLLLVNQLSAQYIAETDIRHYISDNGDIYSDKIAKFVVKCNATSNGKVIDRICNIFTYIFVDEAQDMAGYDYDIIKELLTHAAGVLIVGDPRQYTYHTHYEKYNSQYSNGRIDKYIIDRCKDLCHIDTETLKNSRRCCQALCNLANEVYPDFPPMDSAQGETHEHTGVFFVQSSSVDKYLDAYRPVQLRHDRKKQVNPQYDVMNFGVSKGLTFDHVLIYPTAKMLTWIKDHTTQLETLTRSKLYVALTRAKFSVGIVVDTKKVPKALGVEEYI